MKKIVIGVGLILSNMSFSQSHIPKIPNSSQYKPRYVVDSLDCKIRDVGKWIYKCDSCNLGPEYKDFNDSFYRNAGSTYEETVDVVRELYNIIEFYKVKLNLPKETSYFKPTSIQGYEYKILMDEAYFNSHNKTIIDKSVHKSIITRAYVYAIYELIPNRLTIHFVWSMYCTEMLVVDSNQFK